MNKDLFKVFIKAQRKKYKYSEARIAKKLNLSQSTYSKYENGYIAWDHDLLDKVLLLFETSIEDQNIKITTCKDELITIYHSVMMQSDNGEQLISQLIKHHDIYANCVLYPYYNLLLLLYATLNIDVISIQNYISQLSGSMLDTYVFKAIYEMAKAVLALEHIGLYEPIEFTPDQYSDKVDDHIIGYRYFIKGKLYAKYGNMALSLQSFIDSKKTFEKALNDKMIVKCEIEIGDCLAILVNSSVAMPHYLLAKKFNTSKITNNYIETRFIIALLLNDREDEAIRYVNNNEIIITTSALSFYIEYAYLCLGEIEKAIKHKNVHLHQHEDDEYSQIIVYRNKKPYFNTKKLIQLYYQLQIKNYDILQILMILKIIIKTYEYYGQYESAYIYQTAFLSYLLNIEQAM